MVDRCPTAIVKDSPADEDEFGSHKPIVDALEDLIATESGGRTIGLEGTWGSGKSTIAKQLSNRLDGPHFHVVLFDTWAHEGDPLRRSFLQELIGSLIDKTWVGKEPWHSRLEELAKRRRVERTRPVAKIEKPAILVGLAAVILAVLLPIAAELINAGLAGNKIHVWPLAWGGALGFLILILVGIAGIAALWSVGRSRNGATPWLSLLSVNTVTETDSETIETPDPTSIEFESTFKDLMRSALGSCSSRRLILVIDNLDRVDPHDARTIWATLQTFLRHSHGDPEAWLDSLWILLPYDRTGIKRLWDNAYQLHADEDADQVDADEAVWKAGSLTESFIDKSVQIKFEVPLPLLTDWRGYLESKLQLALPNHGPREFYTSYRLWARKMTVEKRAPTPRELKQYVNRIGSVHRRWQDTLPFSSIAYYAILNEPGTEVARRLRDDELPDRDISGLLDENVTRHLAALAFNTDEANAQQLLMGPLVRRALTIGPSQDLSNLLYRTGFWETLVQVRFSEWSSEIPFLLRAADRLSKISEEERREPEWAEIRSSVAEAGTSVTNWPPLATKLAKDLAGLLSIVSRESGHVIASRATERSVELEQARDWADGAHVLLTGSESLSLRASGDAEAIFAILSHFGSLEPAKNLTSRLRFAVSGETKLDDIIAQAIVDAPHAARNAIDVFVVIDDDVNKELYRSTAAQHLRDWNQIDVDKSRHLLWIIQSLDESVNSERPALVNDGLALHYLGLSWQEANEQAVGEWLYEELLEFPSDAYQSGTTHPPGASAGRELIDALQADRNHKAVILLANEIALWEGGFDLIDRLAAQEGCGMLPSSLISAFWQDDDFVNSLTGERFFKLWPHISVAGSAENRDLHEFVHLVCRRSPFIDEILDEGFAEDRTTMYSTVISTHPDSSKATNLAKWVIISLGKLNSEQWINVIESTDDLIALLNSIRDVEPELRIGGEYALGLAQFVDRIADGYEISESISQEWEGTVLNSMALPIRGIYEEGIVSTASRVGGQLSDAFLRLASSTLRRPPILARAEILNGVVPKLVSEQNEAGLSWLVEVLKDDGVRCSLPEDGLRALVEVVSVWLDRDTAVHDQLSVIAQLLESYKGDQ